MELGLTTGKRAIKNGAKYNKYFPSEESAYGNYRILDNHGTVQDTVKHLAKLIVSERKDTAAISKLLKGASRKETVRNVHKFMVDYLQYDTESGEKLRSPRRTWHVGQKQIDKQTGDTGVDCDDMVLFSGTILHNLNIPFYIRIVKIDQDEFQHVYIIVPEQGTELKQKYLTLDGVLSDFDYEYPFKAHQTFNHRGMKIEYLGSFNDNKNVDPVLDMLTSMLQSVLSNNMTVSKINRRDLQSMLGYAIANWNNPSKRTNALTELAMQEANAYPQQRFFRTLALYPSPEFVNQASKYASSFKGIGETPTTTPPQQQDSGKGWDLAIAGMAALAQIDWNAMFGKGGNTMPPYPTDQYGNPITQPGNYQQTAGYDLKTIGFGVAAIAVGVLGYKLFTASKKA